MKKKQKLTSTDLVARFETLISKYRDTTDAILHAYKDKMSADTYVGLYTELTAADENLTTNLSELEELEITGWDRVVLELDKLDNDHIGEETLLSYVDPDTLLRNLPAGYTTVKTMNGLDQQKLEQFLTTELYPAVNDQQAYLNY